MKHPAPISQRQVRFALLACLLALPWFGQASMAQDTAATATENELKETISLWAGAWAAQLPSSFIAFYTADFKADGFASREAWVDNRRQRITSPDFIKLRLIDFELVEINNAQATTRFTLVYERPGYSDETYKELGLTRVNDSWRISRELNINVTRR